MVPIPIIGSVVGMISRNPLIKCKTVRCVIVNTESGTRLQSPGETKQETLAGTQTGKPQRREVFHKTERKHNQILTRCTFAEYVLVRMQFHRFYCSTRSYDKSRQSTYITSPELQQSFSKQIFSLDVRFNPSLDVRFNAISVVASPAHIYSPA